MGKGRSTVVGGERRLEDEIEGLCPELGAQQAFAKSSGRWCQSKKYSLQPLPSSICLEDPA
jgi:hypothetical protein